MPIKPEGYNTLKQQRFRLAIKQGAKTMKEASRKAGYSERSTTVFQNRLKSQRIIEEALPSEDSIVNDFEYAKQLALKKEDLTNYNRSNESLARIRGMYKDKQETTLKQDVSPCVDIDKELERVINQRKGLSISDEKPDEKI